MKVSGFTVSQTSGLIAENATRRVAEISSEAFSRPPWNDKRNHLSLIKRYLDLPQADLFIASDERSRVVGFSIGVMFSPSVEEELKLKSTCPLREGDYFHLLRAVDLNYCNKGLGSRLATIRTERARHIAAQRVVVCSDLQNYGTLQMYRDMGFRKIGNVYFANSNGLSQHVYLGMNL